MRRDPSHSSRQALLNAPLFRTVGATLIVLQLLAFWMVCSQQADRAQQRRMAVQVQQTAFSDCLQYVVGSTIGSCTARLGAAGQASAMPTPDNTAAPQAETLGSAGSAPALSVAAR